MRAFVKLKQLQSEYQDLSEKINQLENKYDGQFKFVFDAIRELVKTSDSKTRPIGFGRT